MRWGGGLVSCAVLVVGPPPQACRRPPRGTPTGRGPSPALVGTRPLGARPERVLCAPRTQFPHRRFECGAPAHPSPPSQQLLLLQEVGVGGPSLLWWCGEGGPPTHPPGGGVDDRRRLLLDLFPLVLPTITSGKADTPRRRRGMTTQWVVKVAQAHIALRDPSRVGRGAHCERPQRAKRCTGGTGGGSQSHQPGLFCTLVQSRARGASRVGPPLGGPRSAPPMCSVRHTLTGGCALCGRSCVATAADQERLRWRHQGEVPPARVPAPPPTKRSQRAQCKAPSANQDARPGGGDPRVFKSAAGGGPLTTSDVDVAQWVKRARPM